MIMVKPATAYLDIISDAKELAKNVSSPSKQILFPLLKSKFFFFFFYSFRFQLQRIKYPENMP